MQKNKNSLSFLSKFRVILIFFAFSFLVHSCIYEKQEIDNEFSYIHLDSLSQKNLIEENLDKCQFIKLQTTDDCLIKWILKIEFDNNKIFIHEGNDRILVFDNEGNFLNSIGRIGSGPEEQLEMHDFYLNKDNETVNIWDIYKSAIFEYSYSGELLEIKKCDSELLENTSRITLLDNNHLLLVQDNDESSLFNFRILDTKRNKVKDCLPYLAVGSVSMGFGESKITKTKEFSYMSAFLSDTIYIYDSQSKNIIPKLIFKGKRESVTKSDFDGIDYYIGLDALSTAKKKRLSTGVSNLYSTDKYIYFTFNTGNEAFRVFFDTESRTGSYSQIIPTDAYTSFNNLIATTDKAFVCIMPVEEVLYEERLENSILKEILDDTLEDDNPILAFYYFN